MKKIISIIILLFTCSIAFSQISLTSTVSNVSCFGGGNGSATVTATGGTGPYTYTWIPTNSTSSILVLVPAGIYTVIAEDAVANTSTLVVTITEPPAITTVITQTNVSCFGGSNGGASAIVNGGTPPYMYSWSAGNVNVPQVVTGLYAGTYTCSVTDANGCVSSKTVTITQPTQLNAITNSNNVKCFGTSTGTIAVSANGGTAPYTYLWPVFPSTLAIVPNVPVGNYSVTVTDANGCTITQTVAVIQPTQLNAATSSTNASCFGACNGSAKVTVFGGAGAYSFAWNTAPTVMTSLAPNLCTGIYQCNITDANNCVLTKTVAITQPPQMTLNITFTNATCINSCNGSATSSITGGTGPYTYQWLQQGIGTTSTLSSISNLCPGTHTLVVNDAGGCSTADLFTITSIGTMPNTTVTLTPTNETCFQSCDGSIDLAITGSNPGPFNYQWSNGATTQDVFNLCTSDNWVTITDGGSNCMSLQAFVNYTGINCGTISGNVFMDLNSNCIKNSGEYSLSYGSVIVNPGNRLGYVNSMGDYTVPNLPYGTYSISLNTYYNSFLPTCTTTITTNVNSTVSNSINNNFSFGFNSSTNPDMQVWAYSNGIVPGFVCFVNYSLSNLNNVPGTGLFKAVLPSAFIANITTGTPNTYSISGDTIIWNFSNITYTGGGQSFQINFTVPLSASLGSTFTSCMWAQPTVADFDYTNNNYCYSRIVTGSFDPNDKTVSPVGVGANGDIAAAETDLTYLIRFQNTGNGPAVNIKVTDTLSPNVDVNTFEMLGASHNYNIDILDGNVLRWKFNNILLVDSGTNEPASHGYIQYRIKRTANNTPGTQIENTAYIYFDFNAPVVTNTAINTIETVTGIKSQSFNEIGWNVYPNPSTGVLYVVNSNSVKEETQIQVLNAIGQTVFEEAINSSYKTIDLSKLNNGIYFVKIISDKSSIVKRVVLSQ